LGPLLFVLFTADLGVTFSSTVTDTLSFAVSSMCHGTTVAML